jgi:hypothetical protein
MTRKYTKTDPKKTSRASRMPPKWRSLELAVRDILDQHKKIFDLASVDTTSGRARLKGKSGQTWNIDVLGRTANGREVIFEVRRWSSNIPPAGASALFGVIEDTGAEKGYFVTKLGRRLSKGAKKYADFKNIGHIQISADATPEEYLLVCLDRYFIGAREICDVKVTDSLSIFIEEPDGTRREVSIEEFRSKPRG